LFADEAGDRVIETYTIDQLDEITNPAGAWQTKQSML
jgi:hypothetical protein